MGDKGVTAEEISGGAGSGPGQRANTADSRPGMRSGVMS
jgi:hypothetical protein